MGSFLIITCVQHSSDGQFYYGYAPYVREMNLWVAKEKEVWVLAPLTQGKIPGKIDLPYDHSNLKFIPVPAFDIQSLTNALKALFQVPYILWRMINLMRKAGHIHIRIPGNMGLLAMFSQILFPSKAKTIKYAGNWDPESSQPLTYKIQRKISNSEKLTKNASVLVYGNWLDSNDHVIPFFTASYWENEKEDVRKSPISEILKLVFVGAIYDGKNPIIGIQLAKLLKENDIKFSFKYCGDGVLRNEIEQISKDWGLEDEVHFLGNVNSDEVKNILKESHLLIFVSETEGWPKAVAESMFWGCVPVTSSVSCVPQMLGEGERGVLVPKDPEVILNEVKGLMNDPSKFELMSKNGMEWARTYTLERFQFEIEKLK